jgi:hypothetical protein
LKVPKAIYSPLVLVPMALRRPYDSKLFVMHYYSEQMPYTLYTHALKHKRNTVYTEVGFCAERENLFWRYCVNANTVQRHPDLRFYKEIEQS